MLGSQGVDTRRFLESTLMVTTALSCSGEWVGILAMLEGSGGWSLPTVEPARTS